MRVLGLDTATTATTVALCWFDDLSGAQRLALEARDDPARGTRPGHATRLLPLAVQLLERAGCGWQEIDRIAVGLGPGTFTGLRIGIATARALGRARGIPLVGVSTMRSLALGAAAIPDVDAVIAVLDARRGEVFAAAWRPAELEGRPVLGPSALSPEMLAERITQLGLRPLAVGDGSVEFRVVLERSGASIPADDSELHRVSAINHCRLGHKLVASGPDEIRPEYLRLPDAEIARRERRSR
jgi:tRNA threonylcarbamoyladenosine biosynthesis protein TsaB